MKRTREKAKNKSPGAETTSIAIFATIGCVCDAANQYAIYPCAFFTASDEAEAVSSVVFLVSRQSLWLWWQEDEGKHKEAIIILLSKLGLGWIATGLCY